MAWIMCVLCEEKETVLRHVTSHCQDSTHNPHASEEAGSYPVFMSAGFGLVLNWFPDLGLARDQTLRHL